MTPERRVLVGDHTVEEFYWAGDMVVYVDHQLVKKSYEQIVEELTDQFNEAFLREVSR